MIWTIDGIDFHVIQMRLSNAAFTRYMAAAKAAGKCPMDLKDLAIDVVDLCESWCRKNCKSQWILDPTTHVHFLFEDPNEAMMFKLSHV